MAELSNDHPHGNGYYLNIESYYDKIHRTTWARRTAGMLAGATLGAAYGTAVGVGAAFVPYLLSLLGVSGAPDVAVLPELEAIGKATALFAAVTAGIGMGVTAEVASNAASSAVGQEEKEKREKLVGLVEKSPAEVCSDCAVESAMVRDELKQDSDGRKGPPLFSWKVAMITVPLFAAFGALIALNPFTSAQMLQHAAGFPALSGIAAVAASAGILGMFGMFTGMKSSLLTNQLSNFYFDVVTERIFNKEPQVDVVIAPQPVQVVKPEPEAPAPEKTFASEKLKFSLQDVLNREPRAGQETLLTR